MIPIIRAYLLIFFLSGLFFPVEAQEENVVSEQWLENIAEEIVARSEGDVDLTELLAHLQDLTEHPLNLNHAKTEELEELHMLNEFQIASLLDYISHNGELVSIYELQYIPGFTLELAGMLRPFVMTSLKDRVIDDLNEISDMHAKGTVLFRTQQTLEKQNGFNHSKDSLGNLNPTAFTGCPGKYFLQYNYEFSNHLSAGLILEKDNGEPFLCKGKFPLPDFSSAHVVASDMGIIKKLAIGDFQIGFGQGLTWWSGYSFGKTACLQNLRKTGQGIKASLSSDENRFMRGIGTCIDIGKFELTLFISRKKVDANITKYDSTQNEPVSFSSFQTTGIHSTASEIADKDAVHELITGGHLRLKKEHFRIGTSFVQTIWNAGYAPSQVSYKLFSFRGKSATNAGIDYEARFGNISLFGEVAACALGGGAILQGLSMDFQHNVYLSLIYRNYGKSYFCPYSSAFAESTSPSNERGVYTGISFQPVNHMVITTYLDLYKFPWLKYRVSQPSWGSDFYIQTQYIVNTKSEFTLRFQKEYGMQDASSVETGIPPVNSKSTQKIRLSISVKPGNNLNLGSRLEWLRLVQSGLKNERGFLLFQDVDYEFHHVPLKIITRFSLFQTDSYNSRIYGYESDMLHVYSIPAYYGNGLRYSILTQYKMSKRFALWIKLGRSVFPDQTTIGNDSEKINSNHKTDFGIELRVKF